ncbi:hypothetical protein AMJ44_07800 [candidate division WOR-1 bacterium DG_54_3]|uniref:Uncharacterized protein n=1 Tax=candidate division WOR-1 bacterium DG_54_3 TaxID=1703775 RepID=A0A0S7XWW0_UNCSA|nr:MAG: hypothetical protein AMJ44_07800 [candidate division WOR-1 bacterium DG_54_3]
MLWDLSTIKIIKSQLKIPSKAGLRYNGNLEIRKKVFLFWLAFKYKKPFLVEKKQKAVKKGLDIFVKYLLNRSI